MKLNELGYIAKKLSSGQNPGSGKSYTGLASSTAKVTVDNNADTIKIGEVQTVDSSEDVRIVDEKNVRIYFLHFCLLRPKPLVPKYRGFRLCAVR